MLLLMLMILCLASCALPASDTVTAPAASPTVRQQSFLPDSIDPRALTDADWARLLPPDVYQVMRRHGTERPYTCTFLNNKKPGTYSCAACGQVLFVNTTKFDSGTGWPSFNKPANDSALTEHPDLSYGMKRVEVRCSRCAGHLGHVFDDGPPPTGKRYCINGVALKFTPYSEDR